MSKHFYIFLFICIWLIITPSKAQNINKVDSLVALYEKGESMDDSTQFDILLQISKYHPIPDSKIDYAQKAMDLAQKQENELWIAHCYSSIGYGFVWKGDLKRALNSFYKSIARFEELEKQSAVASVYSSIGDVYSLNEDHYNAIEYYKKAIKIFRNHHEEDKYATVLLNLGDEFRKIDQLDSALYYTNKSLEIHEKNHNQSGVGYALGNKGIILAKSGKVDSAIILMKKSIEIMDGLGDHYSISTFENFLADFYIQDGDPYLALQYAEKGLKIAEQYDLKEQIRDANLLLSELYHQLGEYEKAFNHQRQYIAFRDSINNEEVIRKMAELRANYEISNKQAELDLLEVKNEQQTIVNYALAGGIIMLLILAFFIYQNSQKRKEVNQLLSDQKQEIVQQRDQLEELVNMKDRFFGIISHDLRSPVNSLQGITQILRHYVKENDIVQIKEFAFLADQSINNLSALLDNLLSWALSQQGNLPYNPEEIKYYFVAEEVRNIFSNTAKSKDIELLNHIEKDFLVYGDRDSIFALTRNLVNNSLKFTPSHGRVIIHGERLNGKALIRISDTGIGITEEKMKQLFVFDKKSSTKGTAGEKGSGLGLALCKDIIDVNKGKIEVESEINKGTTFNVYLPVSKDKMDIIQ